MEMGDMFGRIRNGIEDHGKTVINLARGRRPVMIGILNIIGIFELGHSPWVFEVGEFKSPEARQYQLLGDPQLASAGM